APGASQRRHGPAARARVGHSPPPPKHTRGPRGQCRVVLAFRGHRLDLSLSVPVPGVARMNRRRTVLHLSLTWLALMVLLAATCGSAFLPLGRWNLALN